MSVCIDCGGVMYQGAGEEHVCRRELPPISNRGVTFFTLWDKLPIPWSCCEIVDRELELSFMVKNAEWSCGQEETLKTALRVIETLPISFACDLCIDWWFPDSEGQNDPS